MQEELNFVSTWPVKVKNAERELQWLIRSLRGFEYSQQHLSRVTAAINWDEPLCLSHSLVITGGNLYDKILRQKDKLFEEEVIWNGLREQWSWPDVLGICRVIWVFLSLFFHCDDGDFLSLGAGILLDQHCKHLWTIWNFLFSFVTVYRQYIVPREE